MNPEKRNEDSPLWQGADLEKTLAGEDPESASVADARHWIVVYSHLVQLEQNLLDTLARMIPRMPNEARREAEQTNLPVLAAQIERFQHRLAYWHRRKKELERKR